MMDPNGCAECEKRQRQVDDLIVALAALVRDAEASEFCLHEIAESRSDITLAAARLRDMESAPNGHALGRARSTIARIEEEGY